MLEFILVMVVGVLGLGVSYVAWIATDVAIPSVAFSTDERPRMMAWVSLSLMNGIGFTLLGPVFPVFSLAIGTTIVNYLYGESLRLAALRVVLWSFFTVLLVLGFVWGIGMILT